MASCSRCCARIYIVQPVSNYSLGYLSITTRNGYTENAEVTAARARCPVASDVSAMGKIGHSEANAHAYFTVWVGRTGRVLGVYEYGVSSCRGCVLRSWALSPIFRYFSPFYFALSVTRPSLVPSRAARTVTKSPDKSPDGPRG